MPDTHRHLILLGPQPEYETLRVAISRLDVGGPIALITAGWETDEQEDAALVHAVGLECINLNLFARTEKLFADDTELIQLLQDRQDELRHLRRAYNDRLDHLLTAARQIIRRDENLIDLAPERESSIEMVRQLDRQYFARTSHIIDRFETRLQMADRRSVVAHRDEIRDQLSRVQALVISGGHVAIILNRLRIFDILGMVPDLPIVAWSGGAMALAQQVVFFHDSPPQGAGNPEVLRAGMGLFDDMIPLPNARTRLKLDDDARVALFARRFAPFDCAVFDEQTILERKANRWISRDKESMVRLCESGGVVSFST